MREGFFSRKWVIVSRLSFVLTRKRTKFLPRYLPWSFSREGASFRQLSHQVAQKLRRMTFPLCSLIWTAFP